AWSRVSLVVLNLIHVNRSFDYLFIGSFRRPWASSSQSRQQGGRDLSCKASFRNHRMRHCRLMRLTRQSEALRESVTPLNLSLPAGYEGANPWTIPTTLLIPSTRLTRKSSPTQLPMRHWRLQRARRGGVYPPYTPFLPNKLHPAPVEFPVL